MSKEWELKKQRDELASKIQNINVELEAISKMTPTQRVADAIHEKMCHWNHTDGCGWYYDSWEKGSARREYLAKAQNLLSTYDEKIILSIVEAL